MAEQKSLVSRRNMLLGLAGGAVAAGGITVQQTGMGSEDFAELLRPVGLGRRGVNLATASKDDWALHVGTFFTAQNGQVLKLVDVKGFRERAKRPSGLRPQAFLARFDVASGAAMPGDQIYRVSHAEGGEFDIFLVAPGDPSAPQRMLATFG
jgi:hypothetical protein